MFFFLWANKGRVADPDFRKYFGFLYRNYTTSTGTTTTNRMHYGTKGPFAST
jgi:hypothetical protein